MFDSRLFFTAFCRVIDCEVVTCKVCHGRSNRMLESKPSDVAFWLTAFIIVLLCRVLGQSWQQGLFAGAWMCSSVTTESSQHPQQHSVLLLPWQPVQCERNGQRQLHCSRDTITTAVGTRCFSAYWLEYSAGFQLSCYFRQCTVFQK